MEIKALYLSFFNYILNVSHYKDNLKQKKIILDHICLDLPFFSGMKF